MSKLHVRHIREAVERSFRDLIDLSDYAMASTHQNEKVFLTRALAALAVQRFANLAPEEAAKTVVDGTNDNGIDAIYIDQQLSKVILVQSKWDGAGTGSLGLGDARNFIAGFKDLTDEKFDRFNAKVRQHEEKISNALSQTDVTFLLVVATTGITEFSEPVRNVFDDFIKEMGSSGDPLAEVEHLGLREFHALIAQGTKDARIDLRATLQNWGPITEPYEAYYGVMDAAAISGWYDQYGTRLFAKNIRSALGNTLVNVSLTETLCELTQHFWYFNNGVTVLCDKVNKTARGAANRTYGDFELSGASVVNGAQTVASIHNAMRRSPESAANAQVWVRFISLEGCPADFPDAVTRATNTQNAVESRDFVALDPEQDRLRTELLLSLQKIYSIKRGDQSPSAANGCTIVDAMIALACANREPSLAVLAKSAIGRLWESTDRTPYKSLFNSGVSAYRLWRCVETSRMVDAALDELKKKLDGRPKSVAVQGNRIILHLVFRMLDLEQTDNPEYDWKDQLDKVAGLTERIHDRLAFHVDNAYGSNYITSLFKNTTRCRDLVERVRKDLL